MTKNFFYYFVEATNSSATQPLVLWLNGGPGCSSLGGAFGELGPFRPNATGTGLSLNNYSWNKVANIFFLESPAGVGFSSSNDTNDYSSNDAHTAADNLLFLQLWLKEYPEYKLSDFYITGESYAGHYAPQLAAAIVKSNSVPGQPQIRLKGIMVGNPLLDAGTDFEQARFDYAYAHGMISETTYKAVIQDCFKGKDYGSANCEDAQNVGNTESGFYTTYLNQYDVLADVCPVHSTTSTASNSEGVQRRKMFSSSTQGAVDPCITNQMATYLNLPEVQSTLHAESVNISWIECSLTINYNPNDSYIPMAPILVDLLKANLTVWIYSGDADIVIPFIGTQRIVSVIVDTLNLTTVSPYGILFQGSQIAGWSVSWGSLAFSTVRGAGHMVPGYQPLASQVLFSSFLAGHISPPKNVTV